MAKEVKAQTEENLQDELTSEIKSSANELLAEEQELADGFSVDLKNLPSSIKEAAKEEFNEAKEEVLNEINEAKEELVDGIKETVTDFANTLLGDFQAFITLFKFTGMWFIKPLSYDVREMKKKASQSAIDAQKYFTDVKLMKALFIFSLLFLAVETSYEVGTEGAEDDAWVSKTVFFIFYGAFIAIYLGFGWLLKKVTAMKVPDSRKFIGFLVYEYAAVYFLQFIAVAILGLNMESEDNIAAMVMMLFIPFVHMMYFFFRLLKRYEVQGKKLWLGLLAVAVFTSIFLLFTAAISHVAVNEGI